MQGVRIVISLLEIIIFIPELNFSQFYFCTSLLISISLCKTESVYGNLWSLNAPWWIRVNFFDSTELLCSLFGVFIANNFTTLCYTCIISTWVTRSVWQLDAHMCANTPPTHKTWIPCKVWQCATGCACRFCNADFVSLFFAFTCESAVCIFSGVNFIPFSRNLLSTYWFQGMYGLQNSWSCQYFMFSFVMGAGNSMMNFIN